MFRNRASLLAFAMIGILFYHAALQGLHIGRLNIGYMGVDIFILFSGFGIAKSLDKNSLLVFYKNRLQRIYPTFFLMTLLCFIYEMLYGEYPRNLFMELTTLSFYVDPDQQVEWYFPALFLFYLLSPVLEKIIKKYDWWFVLASYLLISAITCFGEIEAWQWQCALGRFPIYLLGMWCAMKKRDSLPNWLVGVLILFAIVFFFQNKHYLFSISLTPFVVIILNSLTDRCKMEERTWFTWIGKHSLEIYVSDVVASQLGRAYFGEHELSNIGIKLVLNSIFVIVFIYFNKAYKKASSI